LSGFDREGWEERWAQALREHGDRVAMRPANPHATAELAGLPPGRALDAGCGHGAETIWLAARGWQVTALDFAATALAHARATAEATGPEIAERIDWVEADLGTWTPPSTYDLVLSIFVHVAGSASELVQRLADGVAPGGTLFLVGREAPGQTQVSVADAVAALAPRQWELAVAEHRGVDSVIRAVRRA
jgi:2-polyprenyl-3-methyl-5-hydroxy-6-metoxy-1,4-benzoquinol methylase